MTAVRRGSMKTTRISTVKCVASLNLSLKLKKKCEISVMRSVRLCLVFWLVIRAFNSDSQNDSVLYRPEKRMPDGVYLSYQDFRCNRPILKEQIVSSMDKNQLEFLSKNLFEETFRFKRNDSVIKYNSRDAWGYFQNNTLYVFFKDDFYRVPVFGAISYLVANVVVPGSGFYDPRFGTSSGTVASREIREFMINFYDGEIQDFNIETFNVLLARDEQLYQQYKKLSRRKQKDELYRYIRKFNERNPVYFLRS
jgi:hypothetical protein